MSKYHTSIWGVTGSGKTFFPTQYYQFLATTSLEDVKVSNSPLLAQSVLQQCATKIWLGETSEHELPTKQEKDQ